MASERDSLNAQQTEVRRLLASPREFEVAISALLRHHAMLHSAVVAEPRRWSFEDEALNDLAEGEGRLLPEKADHSIAWLVWHMARCEDITMNLLVAGSSQVLLEDGWLAALKINVRDTGNAMDRAAIADFSARIDFIALRAYRLAVGRRTQAIIRQLEPGGLKMKVDSARLERVRQEGAVADAAADLIAYWGSRDIAGLLLMPATRHNIVHLNEILKVKQQCRKRRSSPPAPGEF